MTLIQLDAKTFEAFASKCSGSFMQSQEMAELLKKRGFTTHFLGLEHDGQLKVAGLLYSLPMTGGLHMEMNSGPLSLDQSYLKDFYKKVQSFAKEKGALQLLIKPYDTYQRFDSNGKEISPEQTHLRQDLLDLGFSHDGLMTGYPGGEPDWHYVKDLTDLDDQTLLKSFSKKGRPLVNKALSFGTQTRLLKREELHLFKQITSATSKRRDYSDKSLDYYQDFYDSFGEAAQFMVATIRFEDYLNRLREDKDKILEQRTATQENLNLYPDSAKHKKAYQEIENQLKTFDQRIEEAEDLLAQHGQEEVIMAGALFIYKGKETAYLFSGSYPEFNRFYAPAVLQLEAMKESLNRGISTYNFLGITGEFDGSDSVLRFKQNFEGYITRKMGTFRYYPNPLKFKVLSFIKKVLKR